MKALVVIPAFNESLVVAQVIRSLPKKLDGVSRLDIVVVDDGSKDSTLREAEKSGAHVISHSINRGVGAATKTGFEFAKEIGADIVVTFDADGQHSSKDLSKLVKPILDGKADLVIGSRLKNKKGMPFDRLILNWMANLATFILFGVFSTDSQSGLKAFSKKAIELLELRTDRMEFSSEILLEAKKNKLKICEVPASVIYTDYSRRKGQKNSNSFPIFFRFLVRLLR